MDIAAAVQQKVDDAIANLILLGEVTAIAAPKVTVEIAGGGELTLPRLSTYSPTIGDKVQILAMRKGSWFVLGKMA